MKVAIAHKKWIFLKATQAAKLNWKSTDQLPQIKKSKPVLGRKCGAYVISRQTAQFTLGVGGTLASQGQDVKEFGEEGNSPRGCQRIRDFFQLYLCIRKKKTDITHVTQFHLQNTHTHTLTHCKIPASRNNTCSKPRRLSWFTCGLPGPSQQQWARLHSGPHRSTG